LPILKSIDGHPALFGTDPDLFVQVDSDPPAIAV
jgi:hypothetical protein